MIEQWLAEIKQKADPGCLGMVLVHNGIVRGTSKQGNPVSGMTLSYDKKRLESLITDYQKEEGISDIKVWINRGNLKVGDDIMWLLVAGRFRTDVVPVFKSLLSTIKQEIVSEQEIGL